MCPTDGKADPRMKRRGGRMGAEGERVWLGKSGNKGKRKREIAYRPWRPQPRRLALPPFDRLRAA